MLLNKPAVPGALFTCPSTPTVLPLAASSFPITAVPLVLEAFPKTPYVAPLVAAALPNIA
jgi:hypothetical protein